MGLDRRARGGGGHGGGDWGQMNLIEEHARAWASGAAVETGCRGLGCWCYGGNRMQGLGLLVLW